MLVDVTHLSSSIEERDDGGVLIGAAAKNTAVAEHRAIRERHRRGLRARSCPAPAPRSETWRPLEATFSSAHDVSIFTMTRRVATNANLTPDGAMRSAASTATARSSAPRTLASPRTLRSVRRPCRHWTPSSMSPARKDRARRPLRSFALLPGRSSHVETVLQPSELITAVRSRRQWRALRSLIGNARSVELVFALVSVAAAMQVRDGRILTSASARRSGGQTLARSKAEAALRGEADRKRVSAPPTRSLRTQTVERQCVQDRTGEAPRCYAR